MQRAVLDRMYFDAGINRIPLPELIQKCASGDLLAVKIQRKEVVCLQVLDCQSLIGHIRFKNHAPFCQCVLNLHPQLSDHLLINLIQLLRHRAAVDAAVKLDCDKSRDFRRNGCRNSGIFSFFI